MSQVEWVVWQTRVCAGQAQPGARRPLPCTPRVLCASTRPPWTSNDHLTECGEMSCHGWRYLTGVSNGHLIYAGSIISFARTINEFIR